MGLAGAPRVPAEIAPAVIWHDLECGSYRADLPLWRELAGAIGEAPILEVGAGSGRVSIDLARRGHTLTALDSDGELLAALRERASGLGVETVCADARSFTLTRRDFALCIVPMQTLQLLGGRAGRLRFLRRVRQHLRPGGLLACAVATELEPFDSAAEGVRASAEIARIDGRLYRSEAVGVHVGRSSTRIERDRVIAASTRGGDEPSRSQRYVVELDRVSERGLRREGREAGLVPAAAREVPPTEEHVGSLVVIFGA